MLSPERLLSLACVALLLSIAFTYFNSNESKRTCFTHWEGVFSGYEVFSVPVHFNVTGSRITSVDIPDGCPYWPAYCKDSILMFTRITVCNEDGFILDVTLPKKDDAQHMDVRCSEEILGVSIPCILKEFNMEVHLTQYCEELAEWTCDLNETNIIEEIFDL